VTALWQSAETFGAFVAGATSNQDLWGGVYRTARLPEWTKGMTRGPDKALRWLVIAEDWCGDASNTVPVLARFVEATPGYDLRILKRDEHPEIMDRYLTNGSRSIPIVIALDVEGKVLGHWGPRPRELQDWVLENKPRMPSDELYRHVRRWYAKDRGETTLREVLGITGSGPGEEAEG